jgi:hypothetical protein
MYPDCIDYQALKLYSRTLVNEILVRTVVRTLYHLGVKQTLIVLPVKAMDIIMFGMKINGMPEAEHVQDIVNPDYLKLGKEAQYFTQSKLEIVILMTVDNVILVHRNMFMNNMKLLPTEATKLLN